MGGEEEKFSIKNKERRRTSTHKNYHEMENISLNYSSHLLTYRKSNCFFNHFLTLFSNGKITENTTKFTRSWKKRREIIYSFIFEKLEWKTEKKRKRRKHATFLEETRIVKRLDYLQQRHSLISSCYH